MLRTTIDRGTPPPLSRCELVRYAHLMRITSDDIKALQDAWHKAFREDLSDAQAREHGHRLLEFGLLIARIEAQSRAKHSHE